MKIAIPTRNKKVDDHFGHCEYYTIYSISEKNKVVNSEFFEAPKGCGCRTNIANILKDMGVSIMLAGNMGQGAVEKITNAEIEVLRGCSGNVDQLIKDFLNNNLVDSGETCNHHGHKHGHEFNH